MESPNDGGAVIIVGNHSGRDAACDMMGLGDAHVASTINITTGDMYDEHHHQQQSRVNNNVRQKKKFGRRDKTDVQLMPKGRLIDRDERQYNQQSHQKRSQLQTQYSSEPSSSSYSGISASDVSSSGAMSTTGVTKNSKLNRQSYHEESSGNNVSFQFNRMNDSNGNNNNNIINNNGDCDSGRTEHVGNEKFNRIITSNNSSSCSAGSRTSSLYKRQRAFLSKLGDEELKFIDTSVESDLPPTLSNLRNTTNCKTSTQLNTKLNDTNNLVKSGSQQHEYARHVGGINHDNDTDANNIHMHDDDTIEVDSAVENSTSSMEQQMQEDGEDNNDNAKYKQQQVSICIK